MVPYGPIWSLETLKIIVLANFSVYAFSYTRAYLFETIVEALKMV